MIFYFLPVIPIFTCNYAEIKKQYKLTKSIFSVAPQENMWILGKNWFLPCDYLLFHDRGRNHIETSPLIRGANQCTGFYMITASVMKELNMIKHWSSFYLRGDFSLSERAITETNQQIFPNVLIRSQYENEMIWKIYMLILEICFITIYPANIYLSKINTKNNRKRSEICFKLRIKTPERRQLHIFIVNFEHISHPFLKFLLVTLN